MPAMTRARSSIAIMSLSGPVAALMGKVTIQSQELEGEEQGFQEDAQDRLFQERLRGSRLCGVRSSIDEEGGTQQEDGQEQRYSRCRSY